MLKKAELNLLEGEIIFTDFSANDFAELQGICAQCINYKDEMPSCLPPDLKQPVINMGQDFDVERALCLDHSRPNREAVVQANLFDCLTADQDCY